MEGRCGAGNDMLGRRGAWSAPERSRPCQESPALDRHESMGGMARPSTLSLASISLFSFLNSTLKIHRFLHKFLNLVPVLSRENRYELFPDFVLGMTR
jgi:hypothetical protein